MADESTNGNGRKRFDLKTIATILGMAVMLGGLVGQWFTHKAAVAELQDDYVKLETAFVDYKEKTDERILDMKIDITSSTTDIKTIKEDIGEIKTDIKTLLSRPR